MDIAILTQFFDLEMIDARLGDDLWSPIVVARMNDWVLKAAAIKGDYHWHAHTDDDELFILYKGAVTIDTEKGPIDLKEGQGVVIPKGMRHKPRAEYRAVILMIEPATVKAEGD